MRRPATAPFDPAAQRPPPHAGGPSGVCLATGEFPPDTGGVGDYTARLAEALAALGLAARVLTTRRPGRPAGPSHRPSDSSLLARPSVPIWADVPAWDIRAWPVVAAALRRLGPRPLLHIQYQTGAFDLRGETNLLPLWARAAVPRARIVTTFHDARVPYLFPRAGPLRAAANRALAGLSHAAIFTEPADLAKTGVAQRSHLIPIGSNLEVRPPADFDRAAVRRRLGADEATLLLGYFGFLNSSKGAPTLVVALGSLARQGRPVRLALIGAETGASDPTDLAEARLVRDLIRRLGIGQLVVRTGRLASEDASAALLACDVLVLPFRDGASLRRGTLMAGLAHGLPIVSTRAPTVTTPRPLQEGVNAPVQLRDGVELLLVPPDDPAALARALADLADDPALRARLSANTRAVSSRIAWPEIARQTLAVYQTVFADPRRGSRDPGAGLAKRTRSRARIPGTAAVASRPDVERSRC